jgi:hypothetical protein
MTEAMATALVAHWPAHRYIATVRRAGVARVPPGG